MRNQNNRSYLIRTAFIPLVALASPAFTDSYTALAVKDGSIYSQNINQSYCSDPSLVIGESSGEWRSVIEWDIVGPNKVPANSTINSVSIEFLRQCTSSTGPIFLRFYKNWSSFNECSLSWATRPSSSLLIGDFPVSTCSGGPQWIQFNDSGNAFRDWIQDVVDGNIDSAGLTLKASPLSTGHYQIFRSHRDTPARMRIDFTPPTTGQPDMSVQAVDAENGPIALCTDIDVSVQVRNLGNQTASNYRIEVHASTNTTWANGDFNLGSRTFSNLPSGSSRTHNLNFSIPCNLPRNDYYLLARVVTDNDSNASNDIGFDPNRVTIEQPANLSVSSVDVTGSNFEPGDVLPVSIIIENMGGISSSATSYQIVLSTDTIWGNDAADFGPFAVPIIPGYDTWNESQPLNIPANISDGNYFVGVRIVDDGGDEDTLFSNSSILIMAAGPCDQADLVEPFGSHDFFDVQRYLNLYSSNDPAADLIPDGQLDFFDLQLFLNEYANGCP